LSNIVITPPNLGNTIMTENPLEVKDNHLLGIF